MKVNFLYVRACLFFVLNVAVNSLRALARFWWDTFAHWRNIIFTGGVQRDKTKITINFLSDSDAESSRMSNMKTTFFKIRNKNKWKIRTNLVGQHFFALRSYSCPLKIIRFARTRMANTLFLLFNPSHIHTCPPKTDQIPPPPHLRSTENKH